MYELNLVVVYSIVIPTMWKSERTVDQLRSFCNSESVGEVIIIDNDPSNRPVLPDSRKIKILEQEQNIYVNPAWNLGVSKCSHDVCFLVNDDVTFDTEGLDAMTSGLDLYGIVGLHPSCYDHQTKGFNLDDSPHFTIGWGCIMCFLSSSWVNVPEEMKVFRGDIWARCHLHPVGCIRMRVETEMGTTSRLEEMSKIKGQDIRFWTENISKDIYPNSLNLQQHKIK